MPAGLRAETMGPVDVAVVVFPGNKFNGDVAPALAELQDSGTVRILDLAFVTKDADGTAAAVELSDTELAEAFQRVTGEEFDLLSDEALQSAADGLVPDSSALVMVWENTWASRLATALRGSQAQLVITDRIPHDTVALAIEALADPA